MTLLTNALDAMDAIDDSGRLTLSAEERDGKVEVNITDTGRGLDRADEGRIFTYFFTTRPEKGGTGLGLPIARKIINGFGGEISFESQPGKGTTFTLHLPL